jgi:cell division protein FtsB
MRKDRKKSVNDLENEIESGLITSHEYSNPEIFLPMNPVFRFIKKTFLFLIKMYTKYQIVFNYNILFSLNKIYQYLLKQQADQEEIKSKTKELESRIKQLEKKLKKA